MPRPIVLTPESCIKRHPNSPVWHFEKAVPASLRSKLGKARWRHSLNTTDRRQALRLAAEFLEQVFRADDAQPTMGSTYLKELSKLRDLNTTPHEADSLMDQLDPRMQTTDGTDESKIPLYYAARTIATGDTPPASLWTLNDLAKEYFTQHNRRKPKEEMATVTRFGAELPLPEITRPMVVQFIQSRQRQGVRKDTVKRDLQVLKNIYKHGVDLGIVSFETRLQLFKDHTFASEDKRRHEPMPQHLFESLCRKIGEPRKWCLIVSRLHGCRLSETSSLDLIEEDGVLCFRVTQSKTDSGRWRIIPVHSLLLADIRTIMPFLTKKNAESARLWIANRKRSNDPEFNTLPREINAYSLRVSGISDMAADPEVGGLTAQRKRLVGHAGHDINDGYVDQYNVKTLQKIVESAYKHPRCW